MKCVKCGKSIAFAYVDTQHGAMCIECHKKENETRRKNIRRTSIDSFENAVSGLNILKNIIMFLIIAAIVVGTIIMIFNSSEYQDYIRVAEFYDDRLMSFYASGYNLFTTGKWILICGIVSIIPYFIFKMFVDAIAVIIDGVGDAVRIAENNIAFINIINTKEEDPEDEPNPWGPIE